MKNQYYGDVNDYRKYGLLRCLAVGGSVSIGVCWMLTPDDRRSDGGRIGYLNALEGWRSYDPPLFDLLRQDVILRGLRDIHQAEVSRLIPRACFHPALVPNDSPGRVGFMADVLDQLRSSQLLFFDPDNGIEVSSVPFGAKNAPKYVYWRELIAGYSEGHSLLIYQHYPRQARSVFHRHMGTEIRQRMPHAAVYALRTPNVVFFLVIRPEHTDNLEKGLALLGRGWQGQIVQDKLLAP